MDILRSDRFKIGFHDVGWAQPGGYTVHNRNIWIINLTLHFSIDLDRKCHFLCREGLIKIKQKQTHHLPTYITTNVQLP